MTLPDAYKNMLSELQSNTITDEFNRLSIRGNVFNRTVNGRKVQHWEQNTIDAVIVKTAPISRQYYAGEYSEGKTSPPTCWATANTGKPSEDVKTSNVQSNTCFDCPQNIKGSGGGRGRACRYLQRIAVILVDNDNKISDKDVCQLQLPATSVFGDHKHKMALQTYARFLDSKKAPLASVLTRISFDEASVTPKLYFRPVRPLEEFEFLIASRVQKNPKTKKLIEFNFRPQQDNHVSKMFEPVVGEGVFIYKK